MGCSSSSESEPGGFKVKPIAGTPGAKANPVVSPKQQGPPGNNPGRTYSLQDIKKHNNAASCWVAIHGQTYDLTKFAPTHPGGADIITSVAGRDGTADFDSIHPKDYLERLQKYRLGPVSAGSPASPQYFTPTQAPQRQNSESDDDLSRKPRAQVFLNPAEWLRVKLMSKVDVSRDCRIFRFALPTPGHILGLPVGQHIRVRLAEAGGEAVTRAYTPISTNEDRGWFELLIRIYFKGDNPEHPEGGQLSQRLDLLAVGQEIEIQGPVGAIEYKGRGVFSRAGVVLSPASRLAMVAGGTGITPLYQVICRVLSRASDETRIALLYCNRGEEDILLKKELDGLAASRPNFKVWYALTNPPPGWSQGVGRIDANMMEKHLDLGEEGKRDGVIALVCGRPAMSATTKGMFNELGVPAERVLVF